MTTKSSLSAMFSASRLRAIAVVFNLLFAPLATTVLAQPAADAPVERIGVGSCFNQNGPPAVWDAVAAAKPDVFLMIGDNVYADTEDPAVMRAAYAGLGAVPAFAELRKAARVLAVWDDHDYGRNDAGAEFPAKKMAQELFCEFWDEPADSPRRQREGVYHSYLLGPEDRRVQVILLDTRYFRDPPNGDPASTVLGQTQWKWLEEQLRVPAKLRIVASSIQVIAEEHRFEKWANFPHERDRLFRLIGDTKAAGVVFVSGDRHSAEISRLDDTPAGYPLWDLTASSLNRPRGRQNEPNRHRVGDIRFDPNFGLIQIDWSAPDPAISLEILTDRGEPAIRHEIHLSDLRPGP